MPITSSRQGPAENPDGAELLKENERMAAILEARRKRRGARAAVRDESDTLTDLHDEGQVSIVYAKWNGKREPQRDADED